MESLLGTPQAEGEGGVGWGELEVFDLLLISKQPKNAVGLL